MHNKFLLIIIVFVGAIGAFMVWGGKKENSAPLAKSEEASTPVQIQTKEEIVTVTLSDTGFTPKEITVKAGTKVVWTNSSGKAATVDSADHPTHRLNTFLNLGAVFDGASVQVAFDKAGTYPYHNHYNSNDTGTVTVE